MTPNEAESVVGAAVTAALVAGLVGAAVYVWYGLALSKLFVKLGADSWRGWVPIVNEMEILSRGGVPSWSVVYYFIPVVNLYGLYLKATAVHRINEQLGRGIGTTVLGILLPPVWASLLAWGPTRPVAGVDGTRVAAMRGDQPASSVASGPLAAPVSAPAPKPFSPIAADPSGYALPVAQPVAAPRPAPAFAPPPVAEPEEPAPAVRPAPSAPAADAGATDAPTPTAPVIENPWARRDPVVTPAPAPAPPAPDAPAPPASAPPEPAPPVAEPASVLAAPFPSLPADAPDDDDDDDDDDDELDRTVVVDRRPVVPWVLRTDDGFEVAITASKVVLGRNPSSGEPDVEAVAIPDSTRTLSKTHARLELADGEWTVTDLGSTNGVLVFGADDEEQLIAVNQPTPLRSRFVLGKVGMALSFERAL